MSFCQCVYDNYILLVPYETWNQKFITKGISGVSNQQDPKLKMPSYALLIFKQLKTFGTYRFITEKFENLFDKLWWKFL